MANKYRICFFLLLICGHLESKSQDDSTRQWGIDKIIYVDQFKLTYFRQLLKTSFNHSAAVQEIISADHSGFTEPVLTEADYQLIDSLTTAENKNMIIDSLKGNERAEGAQGKRPFRFILRQINSKWLDSVANKRFELAFP